MENKFLNKIFNEKLTEKKKLIILASVIVAICLVVFIVSLVLNRNIKNVSSEKVDKTEVAIQNQTNNENQNSEIKKEDERIKNPFEIPDSTKDTPLIPEIADFQKDNKFNIPPAKNGSVLSFVLDDAGQNADFLEKYIDLPFPFAVAVLPGLPNTSQCVSLVVKNGKELMLHQPMQAENLKLNPGPNAITALMNTREIKEVVSENLSELGSNVKGINNHEGSLITSNAIKIGAVLEFCQKKGIYFLDSRTTANTKVPNVALEMDFPILERNSPYIDNEIDKAKILERICECLEFANRRGYAIIIGHIDKSVDVLPDLLRELYPQLLEAGYTFKVPSELITKK